MILGFAKWFLLNKSQAGGLPVAVPSSRLFPTQPLTEPSLSLSLPHAGARGVVICDGFGAVGVTAGVSPLPVTLAEGSCQNGVLPPRDKVALAAGATRAGSGGGRQPWGGGMSLGAAGAPVPDWVAAGNVGSVVLLSWQTLCAVFWCDVSPVAAAAVRCRAGSDPGAAQRGAGPVLAVPESSERSGGRWVVLGGL